MLLAGNARAQIEQASRIIRGGTDGRTEGRKEALLAFLPHYVVNPRVARTLAGKVVGESGERDDGREGRMALQLGKIL